MTYVSLNDARAYCAFHNKRLPHVYEWQYIAQGLDGRAYPWGSSYDPATAPGTLVPLVSNNYTNPGPEPVGKYPRGASSWGVEDLVGSVWQMTSEFNDDHLRSVLLRGGSNYGPWRQKECRDCQTDQCAKLKVPGSDLPHPMCGSHW